MSIKSVCKGKEKRKERAVMAGSTWGLLVFGRLWETCQVMASRHKQAGFESVTGEGERRCEALSLLEPMGMGSSCLLRAELMCAFNHSLSGEKSDPCRVHKDLKNSNKTATTATLP